MNVESNIYNPKQNFTKTNVYASYNNETKLNEKENNTSENTKTNKNSLETILEHNKHEIDPKTNNDNQEQSTSEMVAE